MLLAHQCMNAGKKIKMFKTRFDRK